MPFKILRKDNAFIYNNKDIDALLSTKIIIYKLIVSQLLAIKIMFNSHN